MLRILMVCVIVITGTLPSLAQNAFSQADSSRPTIGATEGIQAPSETSTFGASGSNDVLRHRNFAGRPCLAVGGYSRPHAIDPHLYDHVIAVTNSCPQQINMTVCYYNSSDCLTVQVPGDARKEAILGTMPSLKDFRFEFREKF
jgi:hypothetical protein